MYNCTLNHEYSREYYWSNNCIKIKVDEGNEKVIFTKLYLQLPIKELCCEIIKPTHLGGLAEAIDSDGDLININSDFSELLTQQVKIMSKQRRYLCGCEIFILARSLQASLNKCILRHIICL